MTHVADYYERALRVIGRYMNEQLRDVFVVEQDGNFVGRQLKGSQAGSRHVLFEFTAPDLENMIADAPDRRERDTAPSGQTSRRSG